MAQTIEATNSVSDKLEYHLVLIMNLCVLFILFHFRLYSFIDAFSLGEKYFVENPHEPARTSKKTTNCPREA